MDSPKAFNSLFEKSPGETDTEKILEQVFQTITWTSLQLHRHRSPLGHEPEVRNIMTCT